MKNVKIICIILIFSLLFCTIISENVLTTATSYTPSSGSSDEMYQKAKSLAGATADETKGIVKSTNNIASAVISITRVIALGVAIIMIIVLAMKYMMAAPGDRAEIKKHAVVYIVGAVVMFACSGILGIIQDFSTNFN